MRNNMESAGNKGDAGTRDEKTMRDDDVKSVMCPVCGHVLRSGKRHREDGRECVLYHCPKCGANRIVAGQLAKVDGKWERLK